MAYQNYDPRWPTPYIAETDYSANPFPRPMNRFTPFRPLPQTMFRSYALSVERERRERSDGQSDGAKS